MDGDDAIDDDDEVDDEQVADAEPVKVRAGPSVNALRLCLKEPNEVVEVSGRVDFDGG